jgi:misacylated tRNA(Ala) deacylase
MATKLLYQTDSYLSEFQAQVTGVDLDNRMIELDQTAFYPGGGGQPYDLGVLQQDGIALPITRARKSGDTVLHEVGGDAPMPGVGATILGKLDWGRRFRLMRTHTALHILCGVVFRDYGALVTGGDMEPLQGRMDFEFESLHKDLVYVIEAAINKEVEAARKVNVTILPREQAFQIPDLIRTKINLLPEGIAHIRVVEILGLDLQADGGTHVQNTSEVGAIRVVDYKSKGKINKRIYIELQE